MKELGKRIIPTFMACVILTGCFGTYIPQKGDIVQSASSNGYSDKLDKFIADAEKGKEGSVRVVRIVEPDSTLVDKELQEEKPNGTIIYDIKSGYDKQAKVGWFDVRPDYTYYNSSGKGEEMQHQQCGSIVKDDDRGYYMLNECFHKWEYELIPL